MKKERFIGKAFMFRNKNPRYLLNWLITGIIFFVFIYLLVKLFPYYKVFFSFLWHLFAPFLIACFIAYLLFPIIEKIHQYRVPKGIAILIIYLVFFGGLTYLGYRFYPKVVLQLRDLNEQLPHLVEMYETAIYQIYESTSFLPETVHDKMDQVINSLEKKLDDLTGRLIGGVTKIFDMIVFITVLPVLVFYFLKDYEGIKKYVLKFIPSKYQRTVLHIVQGIDESLGNYIRGQLLVSLFVGIVTYLVFEFLDINYSLLLAIIMGLTNIIPYFGPIIGAVPAVAVAATISEKTVVFVLLSVFVIQLIESNLISPYVVGKSIAIHPVAIIFVLLVGSSLAGVVGMILAVPILTIMREVIRRIIAVKHEY
ncbi:MAG TPA: AI-2E family transporter [Candidatus Avamphibacillus sp.]|nr:AI-2E family transporter [Candidatus Avamphibacillus sp.]